MSPQRRREFLKDVGRGMLVASIGPALAEDLGLASAARAAEGADTLQFGPLEPLVALMQETPSERLLPILVRKLSDGTDLRQLVGAAALANARTFGGQDYEGYHAMMALAPAYQMAQEMPESRRALPVLKVLYRNTHHIQQCGGRAHEVLKPVEAAPVPAGQAEAEALRAAVRERNLPAAEQMFAGLVRGPVDVAFDDLQYLIQDGADVHRVVLAWRAWALLDLAGHEQAHTLLRQSVRYCVDSEKSIHNEPRIVALRTLLPKLLDQYHLLDRPAGDKPADDARVEALARTFYASSCEHAAEAAAAALAEGLAPEAVGEALALAANQLVLHDPGRAKEDSPEKPRGSVHGASVGVHASDAANAWRNIARVSHRRNAVASLIVGAYHTAGQAGGQLPKPYPLPEHQEEVRDIADDALLSEAESAIRAKDQARACALIERHGRLDRPSRPVFDLMLRYAISENGALHAEKYYRTVTEEFATTRPAYRWRQLVALARVTASEFGYPAPGYAEACELLRG
jgi:hypothetical protein